MNGASRMDAALDYAARGWPVLPLHTLRPDGSCTCRGAKACGTGKHPRSRHGLKDATSSEDRVRAWGARWEQSNIGIRTGVESGLIVLDIDPRHGGDEALRALEQQHGPFERTIECLTGGGGRHLYFRHPGGRVSNSSGRLGMGLDIRGDGGYVVAPPSTHQKGVYRWKRAPGSKPLLADAPAWLLQRLRGESCSRPTSAPLAKTSRGQCVKEGGRNEWLFSLASFLRRGRMERQPLEAALLAVNTQCCQPPLPATEALNIARSAKRYRAGKESAQQKADGCTPMVTRLSDVKPAELEWLWPGRIPLGKLTLMAGDPGLGKSLLTLDMAARISKGSAWPDAPARPKPADVVLLAAEDDLADTVRPRVDTAGGEAGRIHVLTAVRANTSIRPFDLAKDIELLRKTIIAVSRVRLVIIDPITAYFGDAEAQSNTEVRAILAPLALMAADLKVAIVAVTHLRKSGGKAIYRTMGSLAFTAAARAVWGVAKDPDDEDRQLLLPVKMNIGPQPTALAYSIKQGPVVAWDPKPVHTQADGVLGDARADSAVKDAKDFLVSALATGSRPASQIEKDARDAGISKASLRRGRRRLGIQARKDTDGSWVLSLSDKTTSKTPILPFPD